MNVAHTMRLHIVGSGCPDARPDRYGSAFVLAVDEQAVLVDCGPATTYKMARMGLAPRRVQHLFLTHHHFDHNADLACFVLTRWDQSKGTEPPLELYGPPPTEAFVDALVGAHGAFAVDWKSRVEHPASLACHRLRGGVLPRPLPAIQARDVSSGMVVRTGSWTATAALVHHVEPTMASVAYRFDTEHGSIVFAGDCGDCEGLRAIAKGAGTLVVACTHFGPPVDPAIADVITGTPQVADILRECKPRRVILTHMSPDFAKPGVKERAIAELARGYSGSIFCPDELTTVDLPP